MASENFVTKLNEQVGHEFGAAQQYIAAAVWYDAQSLPQLAGFFYRQAVEERNHAMMMIQYLLDADADAAVPAVSQPKTSFGDIVEPVQVALDQERMVSDQISALAATARADNDFVSEQFTQWFLKEQVEEIASMSTLLAAVQRGRENLLQLEDWVAREMGAGEGEDATAPGAAGGAL